MGEPVDVHTWFSLSYVNYLVLPRAVLQSMPEEWQHRFTALMGEAEQAFSHLDWLAYDVRALKRAPEFTSPTCGECEGEGSLDVDGNPCVPDAKGAEQCPSCEDT